MQRIILLLLLWAGGSAMREKPYFVIRPYLQFGTQHSMRILWETYEAGRSWVE